MGHPDHVVAQLGFLGCPVSTEAHDHEGSAELTVFTTSVVVHRRDRG
jgi:hypothetical protein